MTWGDRQAESARDRNLKKLRKLAAEAGAPTTQVSSAVDAPTPNVTPRAPDPEVTKPNPAPPKTARAAAKPAPKTAAKKSTPAKAAKKSKK
jgi:hypothetical protein